MTAASSGYRREACCLATCLAMEVHLRPLGYSGREQQRWVPQLCVLLPASRYKVRACAQGERLGLRQRDTSVNHVGWKRTRTSFPSAVPGRMRQLTFFDTRPAVERGAAAPPHRHIHHRHGQGHHDGSFQAQCNQQGSHLQPDRRSEHQATFPTMCLVVERHKRPRTSVHRKHTIKSGHRAPASWRGHRLFSVTPKSSFHCRKTAS